MDERKVVIGFDTPEWTRLYVIDLLRSIRVAEVGSSLIATTSGYGTIAAVRNVSTQSRNNDSSARLMYVYIFRIPLWSIAY